jgi:hypothetical protein
MYIEKLINKVASMCFQYKQAETSANLSVAPDGCMDMPQLKNRVL